jgi:hypothetical protein
MQQERDEYNPTVAWHTFFRWPLRPGIRDRFEVFRPCTKSTSRPRPVLVADPPRRERFSNRLGRKRRRVKLPVRRTQVSNETVAKLSNFRRPYAADSKIEQRSSAECCRFRVVIDRSSFACHQPTMRPFIFHRRHCSLGNAQRELDLAKAFSRSNGSRSLASVVRIVSRPKKSTLHAMGDGIYFK